jgi:DNA polymerase-3 subunit chi
VTNVEFRFNAPDKLRYACTMLRRAALQKAKVTVTAEPDFLRELDRALWTFDALAFVPHCFAGAPAQVLDATPIVLCDSARSSPHHDVLVNLGAEVPEGFERFERLIEVVTVEDGDRASARQRWQHYKSRGYDIQRNDLEAQQEG